MSENHVQSPVTGNGLSQGANELYAELDNATTAEQIRRMPQCWHEHPDMSLDEINEKHKKRRQAEAASGKGTIETGPSVQQNTEEQTHPQRGVISKWLKRPARKIWKTIRGIFRHGR